jgi:hypothetical protein
MSELRTIPEHMARTFKTPPSERLLREVANRENIGHRLGRERYLTDTEWPLLLDAVESSGTRAGQSRCAKRTVGSRGSELKKQLERSARLERAGLQTTSKPITGNKPTDRLRLVHPSQTRL